MISLFNSLYAAEEVARRLKALSDSVGPHRFSSLFYTRIRVKSVASIQEKINRKRHQEDRPYYAFEDLTDIVGLRFVTLYDEDLMAAFDTMTDILRLGTQGAEPLFEGNLPLDSLAEANTYFRATTTAGSKPIYERFNEHVENYISSNYPKNRRSGFQYRGKDIVERINQEKVREDQYSSAHFIFHATSYNNKESQKIPVEVQIRTVAEDMWAEINHKRSYKMKHPFIWSRKIQSLYDELESDSSELKARVESLSRSIDRFVSHSEQVQQEFKNFQQPSTPVHNSLVISLIFAMGNEYTDETDQLLSEYGKLIKLISKSFTKTTIDTHCASALTILEKLRAPLLDAIPLNTDADKKLYQSRRGLLDFERSRLSMIPVLSDVQKQIVKEGDQPLPVPKDQVELLNRIFDELCTIKNDVDTPVRPQAAITFWKYLSLRYISQARADDYLRVAVDELHFDITLPEWSIYKLVIPQELAFRLTSDVRRQLGLGVPATDIDALNVEKISRNPSSFVNMESRLVESFSLIIDAYNQSVLRNNKRGDLIFQAKETTTRDLVVLLCEVYIIYYKIFKRPITKNRNQIERRFWKIFIDAKHKRRKAKHVEDETLQDWIGRVQRVREEGDP